jgi:hypothetical protein
MEVPLQRKRLSPAEVGMEWEGQGEKEIAWGMK